MGVSDPSDGRCPVTQLIYCFKANRQYYVLWTFEVSIMDIKKLWSEVKLDL